MEAGTDSDWAEPLDMVDLARLPARAAELSDPDLARVVANLPEVMRAAVMSAGLGESVSGMPTGESLPQPSAAPEQAPGASTSSQTGWSSRVSPADLVLAPRFSYVDRNQAGPFGAEETWGSDEGSATTGFPTSMEMVGAGAQSAGQAGIHFADIQRDPDGPQPTPELGAPDLAAPIDYDALAEQVFDQLRWRISVERERLGGWD
jgi:hypothetical protein